MAWPKDPKFDPKKGYYNAFLKQWVTSDEALEDRDEIDAARDFDERITLAARIRGREEAVEKRFSMTKEGVYVDTDMLPDADAPIKTRKASFGYLFAVLIEAVAERYPVDPSAPAVLGSKLPDGNYYFSVVRFMEAGGRKKQVVANGKDARVEVAVRRCGSNWLSKECGFSSSGEAIKRAWQAFQSTAEEPVPSEKTRISKTKDGSTVIETSDGRVVLRDGFRGVRREKTPPRRTVGRFGGLEVDEDESEEGEQWRR